MKKVIIGVLSAVCGLSVAADTYYADASRAVSGDGRTEATAVRTLQEAVDLATQDGDIVIVLPGVYDEGSTIPDTATLPTRVYLTRRITLKSKSGKEATHIVGRRNSPTMGSGCGANAMRCITLAAGAKGSIIDGFTIRDGATLSVTTGSGIDRQGGGVWAHESSVGYDYYVCNSTIRDCESPAGGGMHCGTAVSSLFIHNYSGSDGSAGKRTAFVSSVIVRNFGYYVFGSGGGMAVNCTIVENGSDAFYPSYGYDPKAYNCIIGISRSIGGASSNTGIIRHSVTDSARAYWGTDEDNVTADYSTLFMGPARGDFRILPTSAAVGRGDPALLAEVSVPAAYANRDYFGDEIDVSGATIHAGAVKSTATPQSAMVRVSYPQQISVDGFPVAPDTMNSYFYSDTYPAQVRVTSSFAHVFRFRNATKSVHFYPDRENGIWFTMPPTGTALQDLRVDAAADILYVDGNVAVSGDGKSPAAAKRTIQEAVDAATADKTLIYVSPGVYDEGAAYAGALSNRVAITAYETCVRATGSPSETFIVGAPDPATGGYGYDATRCILMNKAGAVQGFTITGGWTASATDATHTDADCRNGGAFFAKSSSSNSQITDCVVSNNHAAIGSFTYHGSAYRCFAKDNPYSSQESYSGTYVSCLLSRSSAANYAYMNNTRFLNCTLYSAVPCTILCDTTCRFYNTVLHNCGAWNPYNGTCHFWGNALNGNSTFSPTRSDGNGELESSYTNVSVDFADAANGDFRTTPSDALDVAGEAFDKVSDHWVYSGGEYSGGSLKITSGRVRAGAVSLDCDKVVTITNLHGTVTIENGRIGENALGEARAITITATGTSRPFLGFRVDGVLLPRGSDTLVVDSSYAGKLVEAVYVTDWYVDCNNGDDNNDGVTSATAKRTLQAVLSAGLKADDTVHAAPGVYNEGEMYYSDVFYNKGDGVCELPSRAVVPAGVSLVADEGPETTSIVGETSSSPDAYGNGPDAMRCVTLAPAAKVIGFTLTGGHTLATTTSTNDDDKNGGGVIGVNLNSCVAENCIITGNSAVRGGGAISATLVNCRVCGNAAGESGAAAFFANCHGCYFDNYITDTHVLAFYLKVHDCTFGPALYASDGTTQKAAFGNPNSLSGDWGGSVANNVFLFPVSWSSSADVMAYNSVFVDNAMIAKQNTSSCVFVADASTWFEGVVPRPLSDSPVVGIADVEKMSPLLADKDVAGSPRISNGAVDPGAFQSDWRPTYRRDLGAKRDFTCVTASPCLVETPSRGVRLDDVGIAFESKNALTNQELHFEAIVDGNGQLVIEQNGEVCATFTAADSPISTNIPLPNGAMALISVRYVPGDGDPGSAELKRFRLNFESGVLIIVE